MISPLTVTMNSIVVIKDKDLKKTMTVELVYPGNADIRRGKISILSPLGTALLGYKEGDKISFEIPKGRKTIKIVCIAYQPESNEEYDK